MSSPDLDDVTRLVHSLVPILGQMGIEVVEADHGRATASLPAAPNANHFGAVYAGSLFSVAEMLGGVLAMSTFGHLEGAVPLVTKLDIEFLRPALTAVRASTTLSADEIERVGAEFAESGRARFELSTDVADAEGTVVATTRGVYQLRRLG